MKHNKNFLIFLLIAMMFIYTVIFISCKRETNTTSPIDTSTNETNDPSDHPQSNQTSSSEVGEEQETDSLLLDPSLGKMLHRESLHSYPATMGPPGFNSIWKDNEIFVSTGDSSFTKIALSNNTMIPEESYFFYRSFIHSSDNYFLCRDKNVVYCLTKKNAKELWKKDSSSSEQDYYFAVNPETVVNMRFLNTVQEGIVTCFHAQDGQALWTKTLLNKTQSFLGFSPRILLFTEGSSLVGIHPRSGEKSWEIKNVLDLAEQPYQQEYFRNFRILSDGTIFIPLKENGTPFAYRIEPENGQVLTEFRIDTTDKLRFHTSYTETPSCIIAGYRNNMEYFLVAFDKQSGSILWETSINTYLGEFAKKYGVEFEFTNFGHEDQILIKISYSTILCLNIHNGTIRWIVHSEFSQMDTIWNNSIYVRLVESELNQWRIEFISLDTGDLIRQWYLPDSYQPPTAPIELLHTTDSSVVLRLDINDQPRWIIFQPSNSVIEYAGYLSPSQENGSSNLAFFVSSLKDQCLFLTSGDKGYELEILDILD
jgi:outer membrane protein assembly factor BamB